VKYLKLENKATLDKIGQLQEEIAQLKNILSMHQKYHETPM
jgi:hypothetical protein